ncbi:MAG: XkdF-like putative serine protease domain-containing protein [Campylobacterales bacterium]
MPRKLKDMNITHISLVNKGANKRNIIFKSADAEPKHEKEVSLVKYDDKKGIVYGIVYAPNDIDTQDEFATADEIEKAAFGFMKSLNAKNVDKNHDFENKDAFVAESWIVKSGDALFPNDVGAWAVGIKLESDELKQAVAKGEIGGLSMAGTAVKEEVASSSFNVADMVKSVVEGVRKAFESKDKKEGDSAELEAVIKKEVSAAFAKSEEIEKQNKELSEKLQKTEEELKAANAEKAKAVEELTKSKQNTEPTKFDAKNASEIAKAANDYMAEMQTKGITVTASEAVAHITKGETK